MTPDRTTSQTRGLSLMRELDNVVIQEVCKFYPSMLSMAIEQFTSSKIDVPVHDFVNINSNLRGLIRNYLWPWTRHWLQQFREWHLDSPVIFWSPMIQSRIRNPCIANTLGRFAVRLKLGYLTRCVELYRIVPRGERARTIIRGPGCSLTGLRW